MKLKHLYLILFILGVILPLAAFMPAYFDGTVTMKDFFTVPFAHPASAFLTYDLLVAAAVALVFMIIEGRRLKIKNYWLPVILVFLIGTGAALSFFLYLREVGLSPAVKSLPISNK